MGAERRSGDSSFFERASRDARGEENLAHHRQLAAEADGMLERLCMHTHLSLSLHLSVSLSLYIYIYI